MKNNITDIQSAIDAGKALGSPIMVNGTPIIIAPEGSKIEDLSRLRQYPARVEQVVNVHTVKSFTDYYNQFCSTDSIIFMDVRNAAISAIFDYHGDEPAYCAHRLRFKLLETTEWIDWKTSDGKWMDQTTFGSFLEDNLEEIINPAGAEILEMALNLRAKKNVNFEQSTRLKNGDIKFVFEETTAATAGVKGEMKIPDKLTIGLILFEGGDAYQIEARFRYHIKDQRLLMKYDLIRPHKTRNAALDETLDMIVEKMADGLAIFGSI